MIQRWRLAARWHNTRAVLKDAWPVLVAVLGLLAALAIGYGSFPEDPSKAVVFAGLILEWLGLALVALGIWQLRKRFRRPSWFRRLGIALLRPRDVTIQIKGVGGITFGGSAVISVGTAANATTEGRLSALEATVTQLRTDLHEKTQTITTSVDAVKHSVQREVEERAGAIQDVLRQLEDVSAGGIHLESIGLCWLFLAALFTSLPNEVAAFLKTLP